MLSPSLRILSSPHLRLTRQGWAAKEISKSSVSERTVCWGQPNGPALRLCAPDQTSAAWGHHRQQEKPRAEGSPGTRSWRRTGPFSTTHLAPLLRPRWAHLSGRRKRPSPQRAFSHVPCLLSGPRGLLAQRRPPGAPSWWSEMSPSPRRGAGPSCRPPCSTSLRQVSFVFKPSRESELVPHWHLFRLPMSLTPRALYLSPCGSHVRSPFIKHGRVRIR